MTLSRQFLPALAFRLCVGVASAQTPDFDREVLPIFETSCTICHGAELQESQLRLDSEAAVMQGSVSGRIVAPGDSDASLLVRRLLGEDEPQMLAVERQIPCFTSLDTARAAVESLLMERGNYLVQPTCEYRDGR